MTAAAGSSRPATPFRFLKHLGSGIALAAVIAALSGLTVLASYQGAQAGSERRIGEAEAGRILEAAQAAYATANQETIEDYARYDAWYLHRGDPERAAEYRSAFSPALLAAVERSAEDPFDAAYHQAMYAHPDSLFAEADGRFALTRGQGERSDRLQLVVMTAAIGLALAAWACLLGRESRLRLLLAALAATALVAGLATYLTAPSVPG